MRFSSLLALLSFFFLIYCPFLANAQSINVLRIDSGINEEFSDMTIDNWGALGFGGANGGVHEYYSGQWYTLVSTATNSHPVTSICATEDGYMFGTLDDGIKSYSMYNPDPSYIDINAINTENADIPTDEIGFVFSTPSEIFTEFVGHGLWNTNFWSYDTIVSSQDFSGNRFADGLGVKFEYYYPLAGWVFLADGDKLLVWKDRGLFTLETSTVSPNTSINDIAHDNNVSVYLATDNGILKYEVGSGWSKIAEFESANYSKVIVHESQIWASKTNGDISILNEDGIQEFSASTYGLPNHINSWEVLDGAVWAIGPENGVLMKLTYEPVIDEGDDGFDTAEDCDDTNPLINPDAEEIPDDGIDNNCNGEIDENAIVATCDSICVGFPHPTLGGMVFYLNGDGGGLMINDSDLRNDQFNNLSMFRWAEPEHLRTETGLEYFNFSDWSMTSTHTDQKIIDAYGAAGNFAAKAIREQLGPEWRLPTATEAYYMDLNLNQSNLGNFAKGHYWTSSEVVYNAANIAPPNVVAIDMTDGTITEDMAKIQALKVRAVRSFE